MTVLQSDGGKSSKINSFSGNDTLQYIGKQSACINAANLALIDAGVAMTDFIVSCSAGYLEKTPITGAVRPNTDPNYSKL